MGRCHTQTVENHRMLIGNLKFMVDVVGVSYHIHPNIVCGVGRHTFSLAFLIWVQRVLSSYRTLEWFSVDYIWFVAVLDESKHFAKLQCRTCMIIMNAHWTHEWVLSMRTPIMGEFRLRLDYIARYMYEGYGNEHKFMQCTFTAQTLLLSRKYI